MLRTHGQTRADTTVRHMSIPETQEPTGPADICRVWPVYPQDVHQTLSAVDSHQGISKEERTVNSLLLIFVYA